MNVNKKLSHIEFLNREYNISHLSYEREMAFFQSIKEGNAEEANRLFKPFNQFCTESSTASTKTRFIGLSIRLKKFKISVLLIQFIMRRTLIKLIGSVSLG